MQIACGTYKEIVKKLDKLVQNSKKTGGLDKFLKLKDNEVKLKALYLIQELELAKHIL